MSCCNIPLISTAFTGSGTTFAGCMRVANTHCTAQNDFFFCKCKLKKKKNCCMF